jgi:hypothetical protein
MTETRLDNSNLKNNLAIFKLGSKFKPNTNYQFDYDVSFRKSTQTEDNDLVTNSITLILMGILLKTTLLSLLKSKSQ